MPNDKSPQNLIKALSVGQLARRELLQFGIAALGATTVTPSLGWAAPDDAEKLYSEAKKEKKVVWWTAHYALSAAEAVRSAFAQKYPGVEVEFIRQTAQVIYQRLTQNLKVRVREVDVFASTDEAHYVTLKSQGALAAYTPLGISNLPKQYQEIDKDHTYHVGAFGLMLINHRAKLENPPQKWTDLLDSKWHEKITLGHPGFSGYVGNWVVALSDKYGWDYFTKLAKNKPKIARSVFDTVTDIVSGERQVGAGPDNNSLESKAKGNPIEIQFPSDDSILIASPVAIMKDAPHPNAARLFESFFYSREYSETMAKTFNYPLRSDVPPPSGVSLEKLKLYRNKADRLEKGVPEVVAKWRETFGV